MKMKDLITTIIYFALIITYFMIIPFFVYELVNKDVILTFCGSILLIMTFVYLTYKILIEGG